MTIQYTSAKAFEQNQPKLRELKAKVLSLIEEANLFDGISNHEIASRLQVPTATLSGLTRPLVKAGLVRQLKKRPCRITGNMVIAWVKNQEPLVVEPTEILQEKLL